MHHRRPARLWPALLALACGPQTASTDAATDGDGSTTNSSTTISAGLTTGPTEGSGSGAGEVMEPEASCTALCAAYDACAPELGGLDCVRTCVEGIAPPLPEACAAAWVDLYACLSVLRCEGLLDEASCPREQANIDTICSDSDERCTTEIESVSAKRCSFQETCRDEPPRRLECQNMTCTCITDGIDGATCPADGICTNTGELGSLFLMCCG